jgi:hypothetical protein
MNVSEEVSVTLFINGDVLSLTANKQQRISTMKS